MFPEESITAAIEAKIATGMPYHWAGFKLALHDWTEPAEKFIEFSEKKGFSYSLPQLGELCQLNDPPCSKKWWTVIS